MSKVDEFLAEERKRTGDLRLASEPLSANEYEDCLIAILRNNGLSEDRILKALQEREDLTELIRRTKDARK